MILSSEAPGPSRSKGKNGFTIATRRRAPSLFASLLRACAHTHTHAGCCVSRSRRTADVSAVTNEIDDSDLGKLKFIGKL